MYVPGCDGAVEQELFLEDFSIGGVDVDDGVALLFCPGLHHFGNSESVLDKSSLQTWHSYVTLKSADKQHVCVQTEGPYAFDVLPKIRSLCRGSSEGFEVRLQTARTNSASRTQRAHIESLKFSLRNKMTHF